MTDCLSPSACTRPARRILIALLCGGAIAPSSGCISSSSVASNLEPGRGGESGLLFGTIGTGGSDSPMTGREVLYRPVGADTSDPLDNRYRGSFSYFNSVGGLSAVVSLMFTMPADVMDGEQKATLFSARLVPGDYEVYSTIFGFQPAGGFAAHMVQQDVVEPVRFRVEADRVTYLGQFLSQRLMRRDKDGVPVLAGGCLVATDMLARDFALLNARLDAEVTREAIINASSAFASMGGIPPEACATP